MRTTSFAGLTAGRIGLGCMGMSWAYDPAHRDDERSVRVIHRALDLGVTLLDTADVYGPFINEELVGRALRGRRDGAVLATKVGLRIDAGNPPKASGQMYRDGRPEHIRASIDASLRRLGVDHVDLYQLHRVDEKVPIEESWGAMAEAVAAGKARAIGLSEVGVEEIRRAQAVHPVASVQSEMSLWTRDALPEVLSYLKEQGIAFLPFSPLGRGFLTGRFTGVEDLPEDDFRRNNPRFAEAALAANQKLIAAIGEIAARHGATPGQVALAWVLAQGELVIPIPGTTRVENLEANAAADDLRLTGEDLAALDALPSPAGTRY